MTDALDHSMRAWTAALAGMRTTKPTYKASLIVAILELLELRAGDALPLTLLTDDRLANAFDLVLAEHGALDGPGRIEQPLTHMAVRRGSMPDQIWRRRAGAIQFEAHFCPVLLDPEGRAWLRTALAEELARRATPAGLRLAQGLRHGWASEQERLEEASDWLAHHPGSAPAEASEFVRERLPQLESFGLAERTHAHRWRATDGDLATGRRIWEALRAGDTSMRLLTTTAQRRQGQSIFRARVLANFDYWCAVCPIGIPEILEAAHLLPVASHPEHGLDFRNGVSLCCNHHRAMDEGLLALDTKQARLSTSLADNETARGLREPLKAEANRPTVALLGHALDWRLSQLRG
jgi:hypothetical protein